MCMTSPHLFSSLWPEQLTQFDSMDTVPLSPRKVLIVDDNEVLVQTLIAELRNNPQFKVVGYATNGEDAVYFVQQARPDIVLMDISMPVLDGIKATKILRESYPDLKIIMLTSHTQMDKVFKSYNCGANAYCLKDMSIDMLCEVMLEDLPKNDIWIDPAISLMLKNMSKQGNRYISYKEEVYDE